MAQDTYANIAIVTKLRDYIRKRFPKYKTQGNWVYRIYADNTFECWYKAIGQTLVINNASGNLYRSALTSLALPSDIYNNYDANILHAEINTAHNNYPCWGMLASFYTTGINYYAMSGSSRNSSPNYTITSYMFGTLTAK